MPTSKQTNPPEDQASPMEQNEYFKRYHPPAESLERKKTDDLQRQQRTIMKLWTEGSVDIS